VIVSVLIPSYRRHLDLHRCLSALARQTRAAEQVVVVARGGDAETFDVAAEWQAKLPLGIVEVEVPGVVQAMNAGLRRCEGHIVAITDDDVAPRPDWLARILIHFEADSKIGGIGGRDWLHHNDTIETGREKTVGKFQWFGRIIGRHHLGWGPMREVDVLKGANCAFRMSALLPIGFDTRLRGRGAQVHWEICLCLAIKRAGWRLVYDPEVAVDHYPAPRPPQEHRVEVTNAAVRDAAFNLAFAIRSNLTQSKYVPAMLWYILCGEALSPGILRLIISPSRGYVKSLSLWRANLAGLVEGYRFAVRNQPERSK